MFIHSTGEYNHNSSSARFASGKRLLEQLFMEPAFQGQISYCFEIYNVGTFLSENRYGFQILDHCKAFKMYSVYTDTSYKANWNNT